MKQLLICRRTFIALISIAALAIIALINKTDVSMALASVAMALGASNAAESAMKAKFEAPKE